MVPLIEDHTANGVIESNRMLLVSGSLASDSFGSASAALFDGAQYYPYLVTSTGSGTPGLVSSVFRSISQFSFNHRSESAKLFDT